MPPDLEPASALAERISSLLRDQHFEERVAELIAERDSVREPLETQLDEQRRRPQVPDLEPASALASKLEECVEDHGAESGQGSCCSFDLERATELIESDRAAVREAALREAIEVVERWTWGTVNEMDTGKRRTLEALRKLLTEKRGHG